MKHYSFEELKEWIYENYGVHARSEKQLKRLIISLDEITAQEIALLLLDKGVDVERLWIKTLQETTMLSLKQKRIPVPTGTDNAE